MDCYLQCKTVYSKKVRKSLKVKKPFWDCDLDSSWRLMREKEKCFMSYKGNSRNIRSKLRSDFKTATHKFDKLLRYKERKYNREQIDYIDQACNENPKIFWDKIKKLGPRVQKEIPLQVKVNNQIESNLDIVKSKWMADYESLYNNSNPERCEFFKHCKNVVKKKNTVCL